MKYTKENFTDKKFLEEEIQNNLEFILECINFEKNYINIHLQRGETSFSDPARMIFIIFTISRIYKNNSLEKLSPAKKINKEKLLKLFWDIYNKAKKEMRPEDFRLVDLYGMRALNNFNENYSQLIENFSQGHYGKIFSHPVSNYVFISAFNECEKLKIIFPYSEAIYQQSLHTFDYILLSSETNIPNKYFPFHFSELNLWREKIPKYLIDAADNYIYKNIDKYINENKCASSGLAKCLEYFAREINQEKKFQYLEKVFANLQKRNVQENPMFENFINPIFLKSKYVYAENSLNQYICLDTNAHIIQSLLNLYEQI